MPKPVSFNITTDPDYRHLRSVHANYVRAYGYDDPRTIEAATALRDLVVTAKVQRMVEAQPPLSQEARLRIARLIAPELPAPKAARAARAPRARKAS